MAEDTNDPAADIASYMEKAELAWFEAACQAPGAERGRLQRLAMKYQLAAAASFMHDGGSYPYPLAVLFQALCDLDRGHYPHQALRPAKKPCNRKTRGANFNDARSAACVDILRAFPPWAPPVALAVVIARVERELGLKPGTLENTRENIRRRVERDDVRLAYQAYRDKGLEHCRRTGVTPLQFIGQMARLDHEFPLPASIKIALEVQSVSSAGWFTETAAPLLHPSNSDGETR